MNRQQLVAPAEREAAVARLSTAFADDVLSMEEFERRVAEVYRASTSVALARLVEDLPAGVPSVGAGSGVPAVPAAPMAPRIAAVFGSVERGGRVVVPARLDFRAVFANIELDLRDAEFAPGLTEISVKAIFGNVEVRLPAHVAIENHGGSFIGNFAAGVKGGLRALRSGPRQTESTVRITGRAVFGNVEFESEGGGEES